MEGIKEDKEGETKIPLLCLFFSVFLLLSLSPSPSLSGSYMDEIVDQVNGKIDEEAEDRKSEQMKRQSTSQQRNEEKKEQKTKDKSKYSGGLRRLQSESGRGGIGWCQLFPFPGLPSAFFSLCLP